jgi:hypothetical protein
MRSDCKRLFNIAGIVLLMLAVAGLSLAVTHGRFLSKSDPNHFITKVAKMNVAPPTILAPPPTYTFSDVLPAPSNFWIFAAIEAQCLVVRQIGLTVSLQHRSPPCSLA